MGKRDKVYLSYEHDAILKRICRGCQFYTDKEDVRDVCSVIGWYIHVKAGHMSFKELVRYVEKCPCNQKCLVKPSCKVENCPIYLTYVNELNDKRMAKIRQKLWKRKSHVDDA